MSDILFSWVPELLPVPPVVPDVVVDSPEALLGIIMLIAELELIEALASAIL
jgi:hypothetical protein